MPTIAFVSPERRSRKNHLGFSARRPPLTKFYDVTIIDADPNHPIETWARGGNTPPRLTIVSNVDEDSIIERIEDAAATTPVVVVDLEGTASKIVVYAITQADLVIIPTQGSQLDANEASRAIRVVHAEPEMTEGAIPYAVLLTRTKPSIRTRGRAHIQNGMIDAGIPVFETELNERDAYQGRVLVSANARWLSPTDVPNLDRAKLNVRRLAEEILERLKAEQGRGQPEKDITG